MRASLRTRSLANANRSAQSISQRLEDYWLGLRLQKSDIPAINLLQTPETEPTGPSFTLTDALELCLRLKGENRDRVFIRTANRNVEYVVQVLGNRNLINYASSDAAVFRDWLAERGLNKSSVRRVFSCVRSIVNLGIKEMGIDCSNAFSGTYIPDDLAEKRRSPIPEENVFEIQRLCIEVDDDLRWMVALISDTGMRLAEAAGLAQEDLALDVSVPHAIVRPRDWRPLKTRSSHRKIPLVGASMWAARRIAQSNATPFAFPRYVDGGTCNANSASAALNKWLKPLVPIGCVVHSFRHSMRDRLRAVEYPTEIADAIGGWSTKTTGERYGQGFPLKVCQKWMVRTCSIYGR